jgi:hypothetical protein
MTLHEIQHADGISSRSGRRWRRRTGVARRRVVVALVLGASVTVLGGGLQIIGMPFQRLPDGAGTRLAVIESTPLDTTGAPDARGGGIRYPYSIVPGGVHSIEDVKKAVASDSVVAEHYQSLSIGALRMQRVVQLRPMHLSYRVGNDVYWTKRTVALHPGEWFLTDGRELLRVRCGNRMSERAQLPVSDREPPVEAFDQAAPIAVPEPSASQIFSEWEDAAPFDRSESSAEPLAATELLPGLVPLVGGGKVEGFGGSGNLHAVPEPGTLLLVGVALAGGTILRLRRSASRGSSRLRTKPPART